MNDDKIISNWVGSKNIPVRICLNNKSIVCKVYSYLSGGEKEFASYVKDPSKEDFVLVGKTRQLEQAKFFATYH